MGGVTQNFDKKYTTNDIIDITSKIVYKNVNTCSSDNQQIQELNVKTTGTEMVNINNITLGASQDTELMCSQIDNSDIQLQNNINSEIVRKLKEKIDTAGVQNFNIQTLNNYVQNFTNSLSIEQMKQCIQSAKQEQRINIDAVNVNTISNILFTLSQKNVINCMMNNQQTVKSINDITTYLNQTIQTEIVNSQSNLIYYFIVVFFIILALALLLYIYKRGEIQYIRYE